MNPVLADVQTAVIAGKHAEIEDRVRRAIAEHIDLHTLINDALIAAMDVVGDKFGKGELFIPEMMVAAMTMKKGLAVIQPLLERTEAKGQTTVLMATVKGDMHDIGKNFVSLMLECAGFHVIDIGIDIPVETMIRQIREHRPRILGLSALLTTTMPELKRVIDALETEGLRKAVRVIVGGAPVDGKFADEIGADGYGKDAAEAVKLVRRLVA